jgi:aldehyde dehydrogenase (NAD+)
MYFNRRLIIQKVFDKVKDAVVAAYEQLSMESIDENNHVGPLIDTDAVCVQ